MSTKHNIIAQSKSGKTYIILNADGTIGFNSTKPICSLANLKWLKSQPNFKGGFLMRIEDSYFENVESVPYNITVLPLIAQAVKFDFNGNIENVRSWYGGFDGSFCHFSKDNTIAFVNSAFIDQDWQFLPNGCTLEKFVEKRKADSAKAEIRHQEWLAEMYTPAKGWYVVTLEVLVSKLRGNDGNKTYSFKVLADNQMDAYNKACTLVMERVVKDSNVSFVYHVSDSARSALIEYVGIWTDESENEFGSAK